MWYWSITEFEGGHCLLDALALRIPAAPRAFLHQIVRKGRIRCGDRLLCADDILPEGAPLAIATSARLEELIAQCGIQPQEILYEDTQALVVFKAAGLAVHRAAGREDNLTDRVAHFTALRRAPYRVAPVHRLDIGTSGPVLFGKGRQAAGHLGQALMDGLVHKHYLALVCGKTPPHGELSTPVFENGQSKEALTRYRRVGTSGDLCLLELELVTGRKHQARCQLAAAGWPIIADRRYGGPAREGLDHPFLHCHRLCFPAVETGSPVQVECPLPDTLKKTLETVALSA